MKNKWLPVTKSPLFNVTLVNCLFAKAGLIFPPLLLWVFLEAIYSLPPLLYLLWLSFRVYSSVQPRPGSGGPHKSGERCQHLQVLHHVRPSGGIRTLRGQHEPRSHHVVQQASAYFCQCAEGPQPHSSKTNSICIDQNHNTCRQIKTTVIF